MQRRGVQCLGMPLCSMTAQLYNFFPGGAKKPPINSPQKFLILVFSVFFFI